MSHDPYDLSDVPPEAITKARQLVREAGRDMLRCGESGVVYGWWLETHTLGCRNQADEPEENWWDSHWAILDEYEANPNARILLDQDTGAFVTLTPQRRASMGAEELIELGAKARRRASLEKAEGIAAGVLDEIRDLTEVAITAGSIRRQKEKIGDIDLVVMPKDLETFLDYMDSEGWHGGDRKRSRRIGGMNVEIHIAHRPEELGGHLFMYTGDRTFEIAMRTKAKREGWRLNQYGLYDAKTGDVIVESPDEREFFDALGVEYHTPEERSFADRPKRKSRT